MQADELACLPVGTEVSAKYKGAFCEAKVKKVHRQVKCRVVFKQSLGSFTLCDTQIKGNIVVGANVQAKHPEKSVYAEAVINKIQDQSHYTVVFDDGDINTLRRNALCMKSGRHFNASESLDNLPLTHPEHFGTPVGSRRRGRVEEEEEESSSDEDEESNQPYSMCIGRVVCVEVTDKKTSKARENWFPGLVVAANAQEIVKINTKEDFLVRSFKDHRYYTVPKKECKKFHRESVKIATEPALQKAVEHAIAYQDSDVLPPHWDRVILSSMLEETSTEGSSEEDLADSGDDTESTEEKDHLVAELYKHMDDRGTPINRTPSIGTSDVDLYRLFKLVQRLGGQNRVTQNNQWRQVAKRLGFQTNWCVNQVRVCYNRYLHSFEDLYRTLGCTLVNHPRGALTRIRHGSGRPLARGVRVKSKDEDEDKDSSDHSSVSSQDSDTKEKGERSKEAGTSGEPVIPKKEGRGRKKGWKKETKVLEVVEASENLDIETEIIGRRKSKATRGKGSNVFTRPRRDSSSSLSTASEAKARRDEPSTSGSASTATKRDKKEAVPKKADKEPAKEIKEEDVEDSDSSGKQVQQQPTSFRARKGKRVREEKPEKKEEEEVEEEFGSDLDSTAREISSGPKKKKRANQASSEDAQHLKSNVVCNIGDKIKVFWLHGQIYEAKILKTEAAGSATWPRFYVHYLGWNSRYDEWVQRSRIAENTTWNTANKIRSGVKAVPSPKGGRGRVERKEEDRSDLDAEDLDDDDDMEEPELQDKPEIKEKPERKVRDSKREFELKKEAATVEVKKEPEDEPRKKLKTGKGRSLTPSSTPNSSRTNSPAGTRTTRSPNKQVSPNKEVKEEQRSQADESSDEDEDDEPEETGSRQRQPPKRTESPVTRKVASTLKRQASTSSLKQDNNTVSDKQEVAADTKAEKTRKKVDGRKKDASKAVKKEKEEEREVKVKEEADEEALPPVRKSIRTGKSEDSSVSSGVSRRRPATPDRSKLESKPAESLSKSAVKVEVEKEDKGESTRSSARLESRRPITPSSEQKTGPRAATPSKKLSRTLDLDKDTEDPYDFNEADETTSTSRFESPAKLVVDESPSTSSSAGAVQTQVKLEPSEAKEVETGAKPGRGRKKKVVVPPDVKLEAEEEPDKQTTESQAAIETVKTEVKQEPPPAAVKEEPALVKESKVEKKGEEPPRSVVPTLPNRYALFPHLASLSALNRGGIASLPAVAPSLPPAAPPLPPTAPPLPPSLPPPPAVTLPPPLVLPPIAMTSKNMISTIVGSVVDDSLLKKEESQSDNAAAAKTESEKAATTVVSESPGRSYDSLLDSSIPSSPDKPVQDASPSSRRSRKKPKLRGPRNYNLKSREVVTDSDTDSDTETTAKPSTDSPEKRRRTISRSAEKGEAESLGAKVEAEKAKPEEADKSLMCRETIGRSPERLPEAVVHIKDLKDNIPSKESATDDKEKKKEKSDQAMKEKEAEVRQFFGGTSVAATSAAAATAAAPATPAAEFTSECKRESKSPESSEVDLESLTGSPKRPGSDLESLTGRTRAGSDVESVSGRRRRPGSADSRLGYSSSSDTRSARGRRRKVDPSDSSPPGQAKRKRKSRESTGRGRGKGRGRISSTFGGGGVGIKSEEPEDSDATTTSSAPQAAAPTMGTRSRTDMEMWKLERLDNAALAALATPKPNATSKYNFYVKLDPGMDSSGRINALQGSLEELRRTYINIKSELSALERRRKKMRKKEKDRVQRNNQPEITA